MKRSLHFFTGVAFLALLFSGCEKDEELFNEPKSDIKESVFEENPQGTKLQEESFPDYLVKQLQIYETEEINTYDVTFTRRDISGTEGNITTTFNYTVSGNNYTPQLDSFSFEIPDCAGTLLSWTPQKASSFKDGVLKWNSSISKDENESQDFSITFKGEKPVPRGLINSTVTRGSNVASAKVLGPCNGVYNLSGSVYIDAANYGVRDASERGIPSIPVSLYNSAGDSITTAITDESGLYSFMVLEEGYTIAVEEEFLNKSGYTPLEDTSVDLENVTEDIFGLNFGYRVDSGRITSALEQGDIPVDTEPTKYWLMAFKQIDKKNEVYSRGTMLEFLEEIEGLYFQFGDDKIQSAKEILERPLRTDLDAFLAQLLTAHLNVASGKGALTSEGERNMVFNNSLLIYGEAVAFCEVSNCPVTTAATSQTKAVRTSDTDMFLAFNGSGGVNFK